MTNGVQQKAGMKNIELCINDIYKIIVIYISIWKKIRLSKWKNATWPISEIRIIQRINHLCKN